MLRRESGSVDRGAVLVVALVVAAALVDGAHVGAELLDVPTEADEGVARGQEEAGGRGGEQEQSFHFQNRIRLLGNPAIINFS